MKNATILSGNYFVFLTPSPPWSEAERWTVHEMARDEARHGKAFAGLLKRYFGK